jgi:hypothetical protein
VAGDCHGALSIAAARVHGARAGAPILPLPLPSASASTSPRFGFKLSAPSVLDT